MARKSPEEQLEALEQQKTQLETRIQKKRAQVRQQERKKDTRRKIIAGALALEHMGHDKQFCREMEKLLQEHVTRPEDRKLFDMESS